MMQMGKKLETNHAQCKNGSKPSEYAPTPLSDPQELPPPKSASGGRSMGGVGERIAPRGTTNLFGWEWALEDRALLGMRVLGGV